MHISRVSVVMCKTGKATDHPSVHHHHHHHQVSVCEKNLTSLTYFNSIFNPPLFNSISSISPLQFPSSIRIYIFIYDDDDAHVETPNQKLPGHALSKRKYSTRSCKTTLRSNYAKTKISRSFFFFFFPQLNEDK